MLITNRKRLSKKPEKVIELVEMISVNQNVDTSTSSVYTLFRQPPAKVNCLKC